MSLEVDYSLILVDLFRDVTNNMVVPGIYDVDNKKSNINYQPGRSIQIITSLTEMDNSITFKGSKYPLIAVLLPIRERRGKSVGFYAKVRIPRIVIATISKSPTDDVLQRYVSDGVYKTIIYPCYYEFLNQLAFHPNIVGTDPGAFEHEKFDNPGDQPISKGANDYVDTMEIINLELIVNQTKTC